MMLFGGVGNRHLGACRPARVIAHYMDSKTNLPVVDVVDTYGAVYLDCKVITSGGGDADSYEYAPPPVDKNEGGLESYGEVLLIMGDGERPQPFVLGTIYTGQAEDNKMEITQTKSDEDGDNADLKPNAFVYDRITKHKGTRVVFAESGTWAVDTTQTKKPVRFQLDKESFTRVSMEGEAQEYVLLADATLEHLRSVHARLDNVCDQVENYKTLLNTLLTVFTTATEALPSVPPAGVVTTALTAYNGALAALSLNNPATNDYPFDFSHTEGISPLEDGGSDRLKAGCFRISSISIDDQEDG